MDLKNSGNVKMHRKYILFILASVVFWFMTKLSKEFGSLIEYPVSYKNLPANKLLQASPIESIKIYIRATGFKLISAKVFPKKIQIDAANLLTKSSTDHYLLLSQQRSSIQKQMRAGVSLQYFEKDSIAFDLGHLKVKKIPVNLRYDFTYARGYRLKDEIIIVPDSITVSGPESVLDTIPFMSTKMLQKKELKSGIRETVALKNFNSNVEMSEKNIKVAASVERFTEGSLEIPFKIINLPEGEVIHTFPKFVKITYVIALADFNKIDPSSFSVVCDYTMSQEHGLPYLIPTLAQSSPMIRNPRISPQKIDFIISN